MRQCAFLKHADGHGLELGSLFKSSASRPLHPLVDLVDAIAIHDKLKSQAQAILGQFAGAWLTEMSTLTNTLQSWCPEWQPHRGALLSKESTKLVLELCKNPHYGDLAKASGTLRGIVNKVKGVHRDGTGSYMVSPQALKDAKEACDAAVATTVVTYALFKLRVELPKLQNQAAKTKELGDLKKFIEQKGVDVGSDIKNIVGIPEQDSGAGVGAVG